MTPKEKAEELFTTYRFSLSIPNAPLGGLKDNIAKQCALIAVDEILNARPLDPNYVDWDDCGAAHQYWYEAQKEEALQFWQEVKHEIENL
jgi:hypothetical protein